MGRTTYMKLSRSDFRLHLGHLGPSSHWLVTHPSGWGLLATELRKQRPELDCPVYRFEAAFVPYLEDVLTRMGLRSWQEPTSLRGRLAAAWRLMRLYWCANMNRLPLIPARERKGPRPKARKDRLHSRRSSAGELAGHNGKVCSNYKPVTRADRLLAFFQVKRDRDDESVDTWPLGLAPFIRLAIQGSGHRAIVQDGVFGLLPGFAKELAYGRKTYNARSETVHQLPCIR